MRNLFLGLVGAAILCLTPAARAEYVGDYNVGDTVCGYFSTFRPTTGALFTIVSEAVAAYKDASATPDTSGVTIDDDFTGTGTHKVCVDTSQDGTFFSAGSQFSVQLTAGTVDSVSIANAEVLSFSLLDGTLATIEAQTDDIGTAGAGLTQLATQASVDTVDNLLDTEISDIRRAIGPATTTIATLASQVSFTLTAGSADDNAYNGYGIVVIDASTPTQTALGCISDYTGASKTVTLAFDPAIFGMATTDNVVLLPAFCNDLSTVEATLASVSSAVTGIDNKIGTPEVLGSDAATLAGMTADTFFQIEAPLAAEDIETAVETVVGAAGANLTAADDATLAAIAALDDPSAAQIVTAIQASTGVPIASYKNAAGEICVFDIDETPPYLTPDCTEVP